MKPPKFQRAAAAPPLPDSSFAFIGYCLRGFRFWLCVMWLMETGQALANILTPYAVKGLMDAVTRADGGAAADLRHPLMLLAGIAAAETLFSRASGAVLVSIGPRIRQSTSQNLFTYLQYHSSRYFADHFSGGLAHRISETATSVNHALWTLICDFWPVGVTFAASVWMLSTVHAGLAEAVAAWVFIYVLVCYGLARRCQRYAQSYAATRSMVNSKIVDSVSNMANAKLFARLEDEREYLQGFLRTEVKQGRRTFWYMERVRWFQFISAALLKFGAIFYAVDLWQAGIIQVGGFTLCVGSALLIINDARNLTRRFLEFFEYMGNIGNGVRAIVRPHDIVDASDASELRVTAGRIEFKNVRFAYTADGPPLFDGLNLVIEAGQRVGLVGYSGSGKSSFVNLILRHYQPQAGQILLDGVDIAGVTQDSLRRQVSLIPQDPSLFHRSLFENIAYGQPRADMSAVTAAAELAHADGFIRQMPDGYASLVGERGVKLSGGQRQRIAIARVLLKDAPILILDEATASLDSLTEQAIQENLDRAMGRKTAIVIAHRLSTIAHLDRILVFDHGRIVEDGDHHALLAQRGVYFQLWSRQAGGFLPESEQAE